MFGNNGEAIKDAMERLGLSLESFDALVELSEKIKVFMANGVNYDTMKIETLLTMVNLEHMDPNALLDTWSSLWNSKQEKTPK